MSKNVTQEEEVETGIIRIMKNGAYRKKETHSCGKSWEMQIGS